MRTQWVTETLRTGLATGASPVLVFVVLLLVPTTGDAQWREMFNERISTGDVYFLDSVGTPNIGFISSPSGLYKTTDRGVTWRFIAFPEQRALMHGEILFKDRNTGWVTDQASSDPDRHPGLWRTTDAGDTWTLLSSLYLWPRGLWYSVASGLLASGQPYVFQSLDEGDSWTKSYPGDFDRSGFAFVNPDTGVNSSSWSDAFILYGNSFSPWLITSDAGRTWTQLRIDSNAFKPLGIWGTETFFAMTMYGYVLRTDDLWKTWRVVHAFPWPKSVFNPTRLTLSPTNGRITGSLNNLFVQTGDGIYNSTDEGITWQYLCGPISNDCADAAFFLGSNELFCQAWNEVTGVRKYWRLPLDSLHSRSDLKVRVDQRTRLDGTEVRIIAETIDRDADSIYLQFHYDPSSLKWVRAELPSGWHYSVDDNNGDLWLMLIRERSSIVWDTAIYVDTVPDRYIRVARDPSTRRDSIFYLIFQPTVDAQTDSVSLELVQSRVYCEEFDAECLAALGQTPDTLTIPVTGCGTDILRHYMQTGQIFDLLSVAPNPATNTLRVGVRGPGSGELVGEIHLQVFDLLGHERLSEDISASTTSLDISSLPAGTYFLRLSESGTVRTRRFVVAR